MFTYLLKRLLAMIPTLFGITLITFMIVNFAPGDPVATSMGAGAGGEGGEGGQSQDRQADAIKAKKRLLGMMREDRSLLAYAVSHADPPSEGEGVAPLERQELAELPEWIHTLALTPDRQRMVVGGDQGLLLAIDASGEVVQTFGGHTGSVWAVAVDGRRVVSAGSDGAIRVHDLSGPTPTAEIPGNGRPVRELALLPDGESFLAISDEGWVKRLSVTGQELNRYEGHLSGTTALERMPDGASFWTGGRDRSLRRWETETGKALEVVDAHESVINDIELDASGKRLATACEDRRVRVFPIDGSGALGQPILLEGHHKPATAVAWVGDRLFSGSTDESVREWDPESGRQVAQVPVSIGRIHDLRASLDGEAVLVAADAWSVVPIPVRYLKWLGRTLTFDFDRSFVDNEPVLSKIADALPVTLALNLIAILLIYLVSVPLGIYSAVNRGGWFDSVSSVAVFMLYSMPSFWVATLMIMMFSSVRTLNWFPSVGLHDVGWQDYTGLEVIGDLLMHLVLPITASVYTGFATLSRYVRTSMLEVIEQDYIRTARAKGLSERVVVLKHAFRNALVVIVTLLGSLLPSMIGGSVVIEYIFSIQGMGLLGFNAILSRDYPMIMAITTMSAVLTLVGILVSDLLYGVVDPRVRIDK